MGISADCGVKHADSIAPIVQTNTIIFRSDLIQLSIQNDRLSSKD